MATCLLYYEIDYKGPGSNGDGWGDIPDFHNGFPRRLIIYPAARQLLLINADIFRVAELAT
jgi:hypothetical protein